MIRINMNTGGVISRLRGIRKAIPDEVNKAVLAGAMLVEAEAKQRIQRGPKTGRVYTRGAISHQASAPGEAPATDTGRLVSSISHWIHDGGKKVLVGTVMPLGRWLEYGTRRMLARPWLWPSLEARRQQIVELVNKAIAKGMAK